jgi:AraC-like DNA-binding protein
MSTPLPSLQFDSTAFSPEEGFARYRQAVFDYEISPNSNSGLQDFCVKTTAWLLGDIVVTTGTMSPMRFVRMQQRAEQDGHDRYSLLMVNTGSWGGDIDGRNLTVGPGQVVVFDMTRPFDCSGMANEHITLGISRPTLEATQVPIPDLHGRLLDGAVGRLVADHLLTLARSLPVATTADVPFIARATTLLLAHSFASLPQEVARPSADGNIRHRVRRYIDERLGSPELGPDTICRDLGLSRSSLYRTFALLGGVLKYIRTRRLEAAHARLAYAEPPKTIASLGYSLGFASDAQFSKAFRRRFGFAPGEARRRAEQALAVKGGSAAEDHVIVRYRNWVLGLTRP